MSLCFFVLSFMLILPFNVLQGNLLYLSELQISYSKTLIVLSYSKDWPDTRIKDLKTFRSINDYGVFCKRKKSY